MLESSNCFNAVSDSPLREKLGRLKHLLAPLSVFLVVMVSIYTGWATVTESAALGVASTLVVAALYGKLSVAMLVGTLPIVFPIIVAAGIDPVFFGVFIVLMCEISLISPPVGMTLYVIQGVRGEGTINEVFQGTIPFFISMIVMTGLLIHFPQMALWLPQMAFAK